MTIGGPMDGRRIYGGWPALLQHNCSKREIWQSQPTTARSSGEISAPNIGVTDLYEVFPGHKSHNTLGSIRSGIRLISRNAKGLKNQIAFV
jgi:hypothetical protein